MYALFIVLNKPEHLKKVMKALKLSGIRGATVIDSLGAGHFLHSQAASTPIIGGFIRTIEGEYKSNKTIFSVIEREEQVDSAMQRVVDAMGGEIKPGYGTMFCVPVLKFQGGELYRHIERREREEIIHKTIENEYY
jgi:nitrogen regulatory protein PII